MEREAERERRRGPEAGAPGMLSGRAGWVAPRAVPGSAWRQRRRRRRERAGGRRPRLVSLSLRLGRVADAEREGDVGF
jgi:hypothetical protein